MVANGGMKTTLWYMYIARWHITLALLVNTSVAESVNIPFWEACFGDIMEVTDFRKRNSYT